MLHFPWFRRVGIFYKPITFIGWLLLLGGIVCAAWEFEKIDQRSHSASDTLINFGFTFLIIAALYSLTGHLTSRDQKG